MSDIRSLLATSKAITSLRAEQEVTALLKARRWDAHQGPYYQDTDTKKFREIDVAARKTWTKKRKHDQLMVHLNLHIEVKSAKDYHILCSGLERGPTGFWENEFWLGYDSQALGRIEKCLIDSHIDHATIREFMHTVEKIAFPKQTMKTSSVRISPSPMALNFSAFRETNTDQVKDLENSVLWRSISALRSSILSAKKETIDNLVHDLTVDIEVARRTKKSLKDAAFFSIESHSQTLDFFVPLVVLDSRLWAAHINEPEEISAFRFMQLNARGHADWWFDVVNQSGLGDYLNSIGDYYDKMFRRAKAKPA